MDPIVQKATPSPIAFTPWSSTAGPPPWNLGLRRAEQRGLPTVQRIAAGIRRDQVAVIAAFETPWNRGPVEGFHDKIKWLKRLMNGGVNCDPRRARILYAPPGGLPRTCAHHFRTP